MNYGRYLRLRPAPRRGLPGAFFVAAWLVAVLAIVAPTANAQPQIGWVPFDEVSPAEKPSQSYMKEETTTGMLVNFDIPGMYVYEVEAEGETYQRLTIPGRGTTTEVGKPEVPIVGEVVEVPYGVDLEIEIVKSKFKTLLGYSVYPFQEPKPFTNGTDSDDLVLDRNAYQINAYYPKEVSRITTEDIAVIRGHRILLLKTNPVQYNPVSKELKVFSNLEIRIKYSRPAQIRRIDRRLISTPFEETLERTILNYKALNRFGRFDEYDYYEDLPGKFPGTGIGLKSIDFGAGYFSESDAESFGNNNNEWYGGNTGCDYLILTTGVFYNPTDANSPVVKLRDWKRRKGLVTKVVLLADVPDNDTDGDVDASDIKDYIQNIYDTWSPPPTYILLFGDAGDNAGIEILPTCYETRHPYDTPDYGYSNAEIGTDLYFVTTDGNDYFPDIYIGRISVDDDVEGNVVVDKIINYEKNPPNNANFYRDLSFVCLFADVDLTDGREDSGFPIIETAEPARDFLINNGYNPERIYDQSGNFAAGPQQYVDGSNLPVNLTIAGGFPWNGGTANITNAINNGRFFVSYLGHGARGFWAQPGFTRVNADNLANGGLSPVVFSYSCETGWFDNETDDDPLLGIHNADTNNNSECLCEHLLRNANGGAVAAIGSSRVSQLNNIELMTGVFEAIWPDFGTASESGPLVRLAPINTFSKVYMANIYNDSLRRKIHFEMYNLFGDPEMPIWTEKPGTLVVDHPTGIGSTGEQDFVVKVTDAATANPVRSATVSLTRDGDLVSVRFTDALGVARFTRSFEDGDLDITVTAINYKPYLNNVIEVESGGAVVNRLDPDNGTEGQPFNMGGKNFSGNENVDIYLGNQMMTTRAASGGEFGQTGVENVSITVPTPHEHGLFNVIAEGETSGRYGVDVFHVRDQNPVDLYVYSQWDDTTWHLHNGDNPTWNNPDVQLYEANGDAVGSNNLIVGNQYTIKAKIHNSTDFVANNAAVVFRQAGYGVAQGTWVEIGIDHVDLGAHGVGEAEIEWVPPITGHLCLRVYVDHVEDIKASNDVGQENCDVGPTASPAVVPFAVRNPSDVPAVFYFELRQLYRGPLWETWIEHPDPQVIPAGEEVEAKVVFDPGWTYIEPGKETEFSLTGYVNGEMVGGVNVITYRKLRRWLASIHAGYAKPFRTFADYYNPGFSICGDVGYKIIPRLSVIGLFGYNAFSAKTAGFDNTYWINLNANVRLHQPITGAWFAYAGAGPGYYFPKSGSKKYGVNAGGGVDYYLFNFLTLEAGADYHTIIDGMEVYDPTYTDDAQFLHIHVGGIVSF
jgi:hypothetical protein